MIFSEIMRSYGSSEMEVIERKSDEAEEDKGGVARRRVTIREKVQQRG